jgi:tetratricopeptide (TPR) repeat protein
MLGDTVTSPPLPAHAADAMQAFLAGLEQQHNGAAAAAMAHYQRALALNPAFPQACNNLAALLKEQDKLAAGVACLRRAVALLPDSAALHSNLGNLLWAIGAYDDAEAAFRRSLELDPVRPETWHNYGLLQHGKGELARAVASFDRALERMPGDSQIRMDRALALLAAGDLARGFAEYRVRFEVHPPTEAVPDIPLWRGEEIAGRTLLVHPEQGFGDTIQFVRYLPLLAERGIRVLFVCPPALRRLLRDLPGIAQWVEPGAAIPPADLRVPLLDLPHLLGTTLADIPARVPYLHPPARTGERTVARRPDTKLTVGIAWAGNPEHKNDRLRSMELGQLLPLCGLRGVELYSLQTGPRAADIARIGAEPLLHDSGGGLRDFADTAAVIAELDLVVGVDTALVHLAGALGRPAFVMLAYRPDWRWLSGRDDSPWYPTLRLFRQRKPGGWSDVVRDVGAALEALHATS